MKKSLYVFLLCFSFTILTISPVKAADISAVSATTVDLGSCTFYFQGTNSGTCYAYPEKQHSYRNLFAGSDTLKPAMYYYGISIASGTPTFQGYSYDQAYTTSTNFISRAGTPVATQQVAVTQFRLVPTYNSISSCISYGKTNCTKSASVTITPYYCSQDYTPAPVSKPSNCLSRTGYAITVNSVVNFAVPIISVSQSSLEFGNVTVGQTKSLTFTVSNSSSALESFVHSGYSGAVTSDPSYTLNMLGSITPGSSKTVTVAFTPTTAGSHSGTFTFSASNPAIATLTGTKQISFTGNGVYENSPSQTPGPSVSPSTSPAPTVSLSPAPTTSVQSTVQPSATIFTTSPAPSTTGSTGGNNTSSSGTNTTPKVTPTPILQIEKIETPNFSIQTLTVVQSSAHTGMLFLEGTTTANRKFSLVLRSEPRTIEVIADNKGQWHVTVPDLEPGPHTLSLLNNDASEARVANFEYQLPPVITTIAPAAEDKKDSNTLVIISFATIAVIAGIAGYFFMKHQKSKLTK